MAKPVICVRTQEEDDELTSKVRQSAELLRRWISTYPGDRLDLLHALKIDQVGFHPIERRALNAIEEIEQTLINLLALALQAA